MKEKLDIVVDFDGTVVTHEYPRVGRDIGAVPVLRALVQSGNRLILSTMRDSKQLDDAVQWFKDNDIELFGIQRNPEQGIWTTSPKAYGQLHIDDAGIGCPLIYPENTRERPYVDWNMVHSILFEKGIITWKPRLSPQEAFDNWKAAGKICLKAYPEEYYLFLDDERTPQNVYNFMKASGDVRADYYEGGDPEWVIVRSYNEFVKYITENGIPKGISFDHDLADFSGPDGAERTGLDCAKWLGQVYLDHPNQQMFQWEVHSKNDVGVDNINGYLYNLKNHLKKEHLKQ